MRTSDCDIIIVPGYTGSGPDHWQSRWQRKLSTARRVEQENWDIPVRDAWVCRLVETVRGCRRPAVLVAHSFGVVTVAHAAPLLPRNIVRGAFLVALPDLEEADPIPGNRGVVRAHPARPAALSVAPRRQPLRSILHG